MDESKCFPGRSFSYYKCSYIELNRSSIESKKAKEWPTKNKDILCVGNLMIS
jgi:hypothetical protein